MSANIANYSYVFLSFAFPVFEISIFRYMWFYVSSGMASMKEKFVAKFV